MHMILPIAAGWMLLAAMVPVAGFASPDMVAMDQAAKVKADKSKAAREASGVAKKARKSGSGDDDMRRMADEDDIKAIERKNRAGDDDSDSASLDDDSFDDEESADEKDGGQKDKTGRGQTKRAESQDRREANKRRQAEKRQMVEDYQQESEAARQVRKGENESITDAGEQAGEAAGETQKKPKKPWWKFWDE